MRVRAIDEVAGRLAGPPRGTPWRRGHRSAEGRGAGRVKRRQGDGDAEGGRPPQASRAGERPDPGASETETPSEATRSTRHRWGDSSRPGRIAPAPSGTLRRLPIAWRRAGDGQPGWVFAGAVLRIAWASLVMARSPRAAPLRDREWCGPFRCGTGERLVFLRLSTPSRGAWGSYVAQKGADIRAFNAWARPGGRGDAGDGGQSEGVGG